MRQLKRSGQGSAIRQYARHILTTPAVLGGIALLAVNFAILLSLLSWADVSLVGPSRAASYFVLTLLARSVLHEQVSPGRLAGAALVSVGVGLVLLSGD
jgi:drug/metabolite transporter (DMT)-like permease